MKRKRRQRIVSIVMTLLLVVGLIPADMGLIVTKAAEPVTHTFDAAVELGESGLKLAKNDVINDGQGFDSNYFTVVGAGSKRTNSDTYSIELPKSGTAKLAFTTTGTSTITFEISSGNASNLANMGLFADLDVDVMVEEDEKQTGVQSTDWLTFTYTNVPAGSYYIAVPADYTARGTRLRKVTVVESSSGPIVIVDTAPVISSAAAELNGTVINVTWETSTTGAGKGRTKVSVSTDGGTTYTDLATVLPTAPKTYAYNPVNSGDYQFKVQGVLDDVAEAGQTTNVVNYIRAFGNFNVFAYTGENASLNISWDAVPEATSYKVEYKLTAAAEYTTAIASTSALRYNIPGLAVGSEYSVRVTATGALMGQTKSIEVTKEVAAQAEIWKHTYFGASTNAAGNTMTEVPGGVQLVSRDGRGKITGDGNDGINYYYTEVPKDRNFVLSAKIHVDAWKSNGSQEGFMVLVRDILGIHGNSNNYAYSNSAGFIASKVEYGWDEIKEKVINGDNAISMRLGIGSRMVTGMRNLATTTPGFLNTIKTFETSAALLGAGMYNMIGNGTGQAATTTHTGNQTDFDVTIKKTNTGFHVIYTNPAGEVQEHIMYDWEELFVQDEEYCYVGFATGRDMTITVTDIQFSTSDAATDPPPVPRPIETVDGSYKVTSPTATGIPEYDFVFTSNANGNVTVTDPAGNVIIDNETMAADTTISKAVVLKTGANKFNITFTPDPNFKWDEWTVLDSYETVELTHTVTLKQYGVAGQTIYVSPAGTDKASGNIKDPMDIYTAVKYVQPGQTIVLLEGTYQLDRSLTIARGINGTEDNNIRWIADPAAKTRPVLDFMGIGSGVTLWGNWWYLRGFDITNTINKQKGIQISGNYNVLDQINAYNNGNSGFQISGSSAETIDKWPSYNLILNCTSYNNADADYADADGFAAKLTCGVGNVFDGCIAYNNADDGWDLYAKAQTGEIGAVIIQNCVTFRNGILLDGTLAGNGNGFKMGGTNLPGGHILKNSIAFENKDKGIDSNSCPDIQVYGSISFNNGSYNVAPYSNGNQDFDFNGVISFKTETSTLLAWLESVGVTSGALVNIATNAVNVKDDMSRLGAQNLSKMYKEGNFYWMLDGVKAAKNWVGTVAPGNETMWLTEADGFIQAPSLSAASGRLSVLAAPDVDFFETADTMTQITRYADGSINMNGLLQLAPEIRELLMDEFGIEYGLFEEGLSSSLVLAPLGDSVPTGDSTHVYLFITLSVMGGAALVGIYFFDKKKRAFVK